jgi:hypothetical protein
MIQNVGTNYEAVTGSKIFSIFLTFGRDTTIYCGTFVEKEKKVKINPPYSTTMHLVIKLFVNTKKYLNRLCSLTRSQCTIGLAFVKAINQNTHCWVAEKSLFEKLK